MIPGLGRIHHCKNITPGVSKASQNFYHYNLGYAVLTFWMMFGNFGYMNSTFGPTSACLFLTLNPYNSCENMAPWIRPADGLGNFPSFFVDPKKELRKMQQTKMFFFKYHIFFRLVFFWVGRVRDLGFDFNTFLEQGFTYSRIEADHRVTKKARKRQDASQLIRALRNSGVPLAVHNGLLDLLHIYHGFIGDLPPDISSFCTSWISHFPLLLDTRHLAQEGRYHVLKHAGGLSLENLYRHLSHCAELLPLSNSFRLHGVSGQAHGSAGQDAMLTAKVLLMQMQLWMYHDFKESQQKDEDLRRLKRMNELEVELPAGWQDVHRVAEHWGVSIYRSLVVGRFGGSRGARRPIVDIRKDIVAAQYAKESLETAIESSGEQTNPKHSRHGKQVSKDTLMFHQISCRFHNYLAIVGASPGHLCLQSEQVARHPNSDMQGEVIPEAKESKLGECLERVGHVLESMSDTFIIEVRSPSTKNRRTNA